MGTITIHSRKLYTLNPDGSEYKELSYPTQWSKNRIGEYKKVSFVCSSTQDLANSIIYFNPALCIVGAPTPYTTGNIPLEGFSYVVDSASTMGTYDMTPFALPGSSPDAIRNYSVQIEIGYGDDFTIHCKYFQLADKMGYMSGVFQDNQNKLLKDSVLNPSILTVAGSTVYNNSANLPRFYICQVAISDPGVKSFIISSFDNYKAGFYNKNEHQATPYYSNPVWTIKTTDGRLSKLVDTQVEFTVDGPIVPFKWMVWMIRVDKSDNTVTFFENYEASFATITDDVGSGTIDNKLKAPSVFLALDFGSTYKGSFMVDKDLIDDGAEYRFISIVYATESNEVNSFISDAILPALPSFDGNGYTLSAKFRDYFNDWTGSQLTCTIEERIQSIVNVNYDYFGFSDDMEQRLGLTVPNDIRRYLTKVTVEIYEQASVQLRNYMDRVTAFKVDPVTYSVPSNMELNFTSGNLEIKYLFRNRYESGTPNIESTFNGVIITPASTQDWGGKTLKVVTKLELFYDDYTDPFTDEIVFEQEIVVKDYVTSGLEIYYKDGQIKPRSTDYFCSNEDVCLDAYLSAGTYNQYRLLTTIEKDPGGLVTVEETESLSGVLPQLESDKILSQEEAFGQTDANRAHFCIDPNEIVLDEFYKIAVIAKKLVP